MDLEQILKEQGYTEEQIKAILDAMSASKLYVSSVEKPEEVIKQLQTDKQALEKQAAAAQASATQEKSQEKSEETAAEIRRLQETVQKAQIDLRLVQALTKAHAADVEYMLYQAERSGGLKNVKLGEDGSVSGVDELVEELKKNFSAQFDQPRQTVPQEMVRTGIKKLHEQEKGDDVPRTLEEAIAQKLSEEES
ncbi:MAG: hypothetical protein NC517_08970 [Firmicutes bacterium]|nr:hypothetical protein [Bacillota bacterium]